MKFKIGDELIPVIRGRGFEKSKVIGFVEDKGKQCYLLRIVNGTATVPISVEDNYELKESEDNIEA